MPRKGAPWLFRKLGIYSCEPERRPGWLWAGNGCRKWGNPTGPGKCACGQELWTAGLIDKQVLTGMWCFYVSLETQNAGFHLVFLCIQRSCCSVPECAVCLLLYLVLPTPVLYLVSEHSQNSQTALELSTEQGRSAWLPRAGAVWMWRQHGRGTHPELSFQKYSFGQTAYSLTL